MSGAQTTGNFVPRATAMLPVESGIRAAVMLVTAVPHLSVWPGMAYQAPTTNDSAWLAGIVDETP